MTICQADESVIPVNSLTPQDAPGYRSTVTSASLALVRRLQSVRDPRHLLELFSGTLRSTVPLHGIHYRNATRGIEYTLGQCAYHSHRCRLMLGSRFLGELTFHRRRKFTDKEIEQIGGLLPILLLPLRDSLVHREALQMANRDTLTGLHDGVALKEMLCREMNYARKHELPLSIIVLNIDHFRNLNEVHGSLTGDEVLKTVVSCMGQVLGRIDTLFRGKGDEFMILLRDTDKDSASVLAGEMCTMVSSRQLPSVFGTVSITVSAGINTLRTDDNLLTFLQRADFSLFQAKSQGGNRICAA